MLTAPDLPLRIRSLNTLLSLAQKFGFQSHALTEQALLAGAMQQTGLEDFGADDFKAGLTALLKSLHEEARLSPLGRVIAQQEIQMALANRLQLVDYHKRFPEISALKIREPVFIIGQGRSGTTIMHELMALDTGLRVPRTWEVDRPFPPPHSANYASDPRIAAIQKNLDRTDVILPAFKRMHRMGAELPQECVRFTASEFASLMFWTNYNVPAYTAWLKDEADLAPAYRYHRRFLQLLQWKHPVQPWVVKSPAHLWSLDALLAEYPDARFIQTHRDPLKMLASLTSLVTHLRKMASDHVDPVQIAREWAEYNALGLNNSAELRSAGRIAPDRIIDIDFYEFMSSPVDQLKRIYAFLERELEPATESRMRDYLAQHSSAQHGAHSYSFADTGLDVEQERARVAPYQAYFNTRIEVE
ncbi:MAG: sulfotransferase [Halioglobus sp.]